MYPIKLNKDYYSVISNGIIKSPQSLTLREIKLVRILISQVIKEDQNLKTYTCELSKLANFLGITKSSMYDDIEELCNKLMSRVVKLADVDKNGRVRWKMIHWVSTARFDGNGIITLSLSDDIKEFVIDQEKFFTQYQIKNILDFKSVYAVRLFEILLSDFNYNDYRKSVFKYSIDDLRMMLDCTEKFEKISQFKTYVIEKAVREINSTYESELTVFIKYIKTGRTITHIKFYVEKGDNYKTNDVIWQDDWGDME